MQQYYNNFDWLRLMFAIQVVGIHSGVSSSVFISPVPAFLAISGFVVLGSLERNSVGQFFLNRALRVLPMLFVSFFMVWIIFDKTAMFRTILFWLWPFGAFPVNPVVWSLMWEEFFYISLVLLVFSRLFRFKWITILFVLLFTFLTARKLYFGIRPEFFLLGSAFFLGNAVYYYRVYIEKIDQWLATLIFLFALYIRYRLPYLATVEPNYALENLFSLVAILIFAISGPKLPRLPIDMSYSLYLVHCLVLAELNGFIPLRTQRMFWVMLLTSLPICFACFHLIERPALQFKYRIPVWWRLARRKNTEALQSS